MSTIHIDGIHVYDSSTKVFSSNFSQEWTGSWISGDASLKSSYYDALTTARESNRYFCWYGWGVPQRFPTAEEASNRRFFGWWTDMCQDDFLVGDYFLNFQVESAIVYDKDTGDHWIDIWLYAGPHKKYSGIENNIVEYWPQSWKNIHDGKKVNYDNIRTFVVTRLTQWLNSSEGKTFIDNDRSYLEIPEHIFEDYISIANVTYTISCIFGRNHYRGNGAIISYRVGYKRKDNLLNSDNLFQQDFWIIANSEDYDNYQAQIIAAANTLINNCKIYLDTIFGDTTLVLNEEHSFKALNGNTYPYNISYAENKTFTTDVLSYDISFGPKLENNTRKILYSFAKEDIVFCSSETTTCMGTLTLTAAEAEQNLHTYLDTIVDNVVPPDEIREDYILANYHFKNDVDTKVHIGTMLIHKNNSHSELDYAVFQVYSKCEIEFLCDTLCVLGIRTGYIKWKNYQEEYSHITYSMNMSQWTRYQEDITVIMKSEFEVCKKHIENIYGGTTNPNLKFVIEPPMVREYAMPIENETFNV